MEVKKKWGGWGKGNRGREKEKGIRDRRFHINVTLLPQAIPGIPANNK